MATLEFMPSDFLDIITALRKIELAVNALAGGSGSGTATAVSNSATLNTQNGTVTSEALTAQTSYELVLANSLILSTSTVLVNATNSSQSGCVLHAKAVTAGQLDVGFAFPSLTGTVAIDFAVFN